MLHPPDHMQPPEANSRGFALLIVLSFLIILVMLFATVSKRTLAHAGFYATEKRLLQQQFDNAAVADVLAQMDLNAMTATSKEIASPLQDGTTLVIQDVGGLIDLNTAAPELIAAVIDYLGLEPQVIEEYIAWRQEGRRLLRTDDFLRVVGGEMSQNAELESFSTVYSGRRRVNSTKASKFTLEIIKNFGELLESSKSTQNFSLFFLIENQQIKSATLTSQQNRIIFIN